MTNRSRIFLALGLFVVLALIAIAVIVLGVALLSNAGISLGGDRIALLRISGQIIDTRREVELVRDYADDSSIRAIVVRVESPGGAVGASQELYSELLRAREMKPVIFSFGNVAASGGYYVALAGDKIFANPGTLTGSVGVLMTHLDTSGLLKDRLGLDFTDVTSGENKALGSAWEPLSSDDRAMIEEMIGSIYQQFLGAVRDNRSDAIRTVLAEQIGDIQPQDVPDAAVEAHLVSLCDGRPMTGQQALDSGFIDQLGTLQDAIDEAALRAGISGEPTIEEWHAPRGLFGPVAESVADSVTAAVRDEFAVSAPLRYQLRMP